jgi:hypothetical protein
VKEVIELLEQVKADMTLICADSGFQRDVVSTITKKIETAIAILKAPRWEMPEQYEKRTGEPWQDDWPVWACGDSDDIEWIGCSYREAKEMDRVNDTAILCATQDGPPPDDWGLE